MRARRRLPEIGDVFGFEHRPSEINYGGQARFQQAAFPAGENGRDLETLVFRALCRFSELLQQSSAAAGVGPLTGPELIPVFYDQWGETPRLPSEGFQDWYRQEVAAAAEAYRRLRLNAVRQEKKANVSRLGYFVGLSAVSLISELISEFFEKQIDVLGPVAAHARWTLGRCFVLALQAAEADPELHRLRQEQFGAGEPEDGVLRLLNPFILGFADAADGDQAEGVLNASNPYQISARLRARLAALAGQVLSRSRRLEASDIRRAFAMSESARLWLESPPDRRRLLRSLRREHDLRAQVVAENVQQAVRAGLRRYAAEDPAAEVLNLVARERPLAEWLAKAPARKSLLRYLKSRRTPQSRDLLKRLSAELRRLRRGRRRWLGRMTTPALLAEIENTFERWSRYLAQTEDFRLIRRRYGRDTKHALEWRGLRLWRAHEMIASSQTPAAGRLRLETIWERRCADVDNAFAEGNCFLCRPEGEIYPLAHQRRMRTTFLFADLRNSTETTMKLTKDTASFLAPYLTSVDSEARGNGGERIYFAGDGYAAYYAGPADAIRAAYCLAARFHTLRQKSGEEHRLKAKTILQAAKDRGVEWRKPASIRKALDGLGAGGGAPELRAWLEELSVLEVAALTDDNVKKTLLKVAAEYSMPRIDAGVAITSGELFFAMVGEEGRDKIPIVISPALTQAARLSGSSDQVKKYLEDKYPEPVPFNACAWDHKLYNRGIVVTEDVVEELRREAELAPLAVPEPPFAQEKLLAYTDVKLKRRIILRDLIEPVLLKGIAKPCRVYEVAVSWTALAQLTQSAASQPERRSAAAERRGFPE